MANRRYTVRQMTSGRTSGVKFYVYDNKNKGRVTVEAYPGRRGAQMEADDLNIMDMVKDYADDPRPFAVRIAEARAAYEATK